MVGAVAAPASMLRRLPVLPVLLLALHQRRPRCCRRLRQAAACLPACRRGSSGSFKPENSAPGKPCVISKCHLKAANGVAKIAMLQACKHMHMHYIPCRQAWQVTQALAVCCPHPSLLLQGSMPRSLPRGPWGWGLRPIEPRCGPEVGSSVDSRTDSRQTNLPCLSACLALRCPADSVMEAFVGPRLQRAQRPARRSGQRHARRRQRRLPRRQGAAARCCCCYCNCHLFFVSCHLPCCCRPSCSPECCTR